jgi:atypical dual specificity phosphatase
MLSDFTPNKIVEARHGPEGFHWLIPGLLGGTPRPGAGGDYDGDIGRLARLGTGLLVSLTAEWTPDPATLRARGIGSLHEPIPDYAPPALAQAERICREVSARLAAGSAVVFHCQAGRGRTGTLLAAQLIWHGAQAGDALAYARSRNPLWVESKTQEDFLEEFEAQCRARGRPFPPVTPSA